jgi:hypothetical protein
MFLHTGIFSTCTCRSPVQYYRRSALRPEPCPIHLCTPYLVGHHTGDTCRLSQLALMVAFIECMGRVCPKVNYLLQATSS